VYVSGAITGFEKQTGIWRAKWKKLLEEAGFIVFDPWLDRPKEAGVTGTVREDIRRILTADILLVNGNIPSSGTAQEMVYARMFKTKVYTIFGKDEPSPSCYIVFNKNDKDCSIQDVSVFTQNSKALKFKKDNKMSGIVEGRLEFFKDCIPFWLDYHTDKTFKNIEEFVHWAKVEHLNDKE